MGALLGAECRAVAIAAFTLVGALTIGTTPAMAEESSDHAKALAEVTSALQNAPGEVGIKFDREALSRLTTDELEATHKAIPTGVEIVVSGDSGVSTFATTGCKAGGATLYFTGGLTKAKLWRLTESVYFCWNYGKRTVASISTPEVEANVYGPGKIQGWKYRGIKNGPTSTAHRDTYGISYYTSYVQAQFELCPVKVACTVESNPWIRVNSHRDGSVSATKGGL